MNRMKKSTPAAASRGPARYCALFAVVLALCSCAAERQAAPSLIPPHGMTGVVRTVTGFADLEVVTGDEKHVAGASVFFMSPDRLRLDIRDPFGRAIETVLVLGEIVILAPRDGDILVFDEEDRDELGAMLGSIQVVDLMETLRMAIPSGPGTTAVGEGETRDQTVKRTYLEEHCRIELYFGGGAGRLVRKKILYRDESCLDLHFSDFSAFDRGIEYPRNIKAVYHPSEDAFMLTFRKLRLNAPLSRDIFRIRPVSD